MDNTPSIFDPAAFLTATIDTPNERREPLPVENPEAGSNGYYTALVGEIKMSAGSGTDKNGAPRAWLQAIVPLQIQVPPSVKEAKKYRTDQITITDRCFIDLTPSGTIDNAPGANRRQRQYREATDMNKPGDSFSWAKVQGRVVKVKVTHETYQNEIQERIGGILRA